MNEVNFLSTKISWDFLGKCMLVTKQSIEGDLCTRSTVIFAEEEKTTKYLQIKFRESGKKIRDTNKIEIF